MARILIVDRQTEIRRSLCMVFTSERNFDVCGEAKNDAQAVRETERLRPDLVILDLATPIKDHISLVQRLRKIIPGIPIFMLTDPYTATAEKQALSAGITAVFSKREDPASLLANAQAICGV